MNLKMKCFFLRIMLLLFCLTSCAMPYTGVVLDAETKGPVKNVLVVRNWNREVATVGGGVTTGGWIRKAVTDDQGQFSAPGLLYFPGIPFLSHVYEESPCFFKPGYKTKRLDSKEPEIFLTRIPTLLHLRKKEVEEAERCYWGAEIGKENVFLDLAESLMTFEKHFKARQQKRDHLSMVWIPAWENIFPIKSHIEQLRIEDSSEKVTSDKMIQSLIDDLDNRDEVTRILAAKRLGALCIENSQSIKDLERFAELQIQGWNDESITMERLPAAYLGRIGAPVVKPLISALEHGGINIRKKAIRALAETRSPVALDLLIHQFFALDRYVKNTVLSDPANMVRYVKGKPVYSSGSGMEITSYVVITPKEGMKQPKSLEESMQLRNALFDMATTRLYTVKALKYFNSPKAMEVLVSALGDHDPEIRGEAALSLGYSGGPDAIQALTEDSKKEGRHGQYSSTMLGLKIIGNPTIDPLGSGPEKKAIESSLERLITDWNEASSKAREAVDILLVKKGPEVVGPLLSLLSHKDAYFRWRAVWALGRMNYSGAERYIIHLVQDEAPEVRWIAITALGIMGGSDAFEPLMAVLNDADYGIRTRAENSLKEVIKREMDSDLAYW